MLNNAIALFLGRMLLSVPDEVLEGETTLASMVLGIIILFIIALFFGSLGYLALKKLKKITENKVVSEIIDEQIRENEGLAHYYPQEIPEKNVTLLSWIPAVIVILTFIFFAVIEVISIINPNFFQF
ncbi:hypothetical protein SAMN02745227_00823 [Anaerobranca californiensis DSM 14826]|uniref:Uncharacterized protein n=1 Tax=Anaerobranca californiensis DSM 14826 TaxID=1120989 RepID=A0A1M6MKS9_9FIRM|nr:hypothetical protein [Anaerobranca californiensis]SHJ84078.1 hypothetical protein SAMN02745227_00823 [Anaerobranca californiensis DSM 14826]